jgi:hypothetical protein
MAGWTDAELGPVATLNADKSFSSSWLLQEGQAGAPSEARTSCSNRLEQLLHSYS